MERKRRQRNHITMVSNDWNLELASCRRIWSLGFGFILTRYYRFQQDTLALIIIRLRWGKYVEFLRISKKSSMWSSPIISSKWVASNMIYRESKRCIPFQTHHWSLELMGLLPPPYCWLSHDDEKRLLLVMVMIRSSENHPSPIVRYKMGRGDPFTDPFGWEDTWSVHDHWRFFNHSCRSSRLEESVVILLGSGRRTTWEGWCIDTVNGLQNEGRRKQPIMLRENPCRFVRGNRGCYDWPMIGWKWQKNAQFEAHQLWKRKWWWKREVFRHSECEWKMKGKREWIALKWGNWCIANRRS